MLVDILLGTLISLGSSVATAAIYSYAPPRVKNIIWWPCILGWFMAAAAYVMFLLSFIGTVVWEGFVFIKSTDISLIGVIVIGSLTVIRYGLGSRGWSRAIGLSIGIVLITLALYVRSL
jgi:hypothetical protein